MFVVYRRRGKVVRRPVKNPRRAIRLANKVNRKYGVQAEVRL